MAVITITSEPTNCAPRAERSTALASAEGHNADTEDETREGVVRSTPTMETNMLTEHEAWLLSSRMHRELNAGPGGLWQCAAGLLILTGLAVAGTWFDPLQESSGQMAQERGQPSPRPDDDREREDYAYPDTQLPAEASRNLVPVAHSSPQEIP